jgi:hypothetical protein
MNTAVLNLNCWFSTLTGWLRPRPEAALASRPAKPRIRIAGLR